MFYFNGVNDSILGIRLSGGSLSEIAGSPFKVPQAQSGFLMAATDRLLFAAVPDSAGSGLTLTTYRIDAQSGALQTISSGPSNVAPTLIDSSNRFAYSQTMDGNLHSLSIDSSTGQLTELQGSPIPAGQMDGLSRISTNGDWICGGRFNGPGNTDGTTCLPRDPSSGLVQSGAMLSSTQGTYTFVAGNYLLGVPSDSANDTHSQQAGIGVYTVTSSGIQQVKTLVQPTSQLISDRSGTLVADILDTYSLTVLKFDPATLTLTPIGALNSPSPTQIEAVAFSCDGKYLAVSESIPAAVSVYAVTGGTLQKVTGSPIATSTTMFGVVVPCPAL